MPKLEQFPLDLRIREINLKRGKISKDDVEKHLKSLPDSSTESEELIIQEEETDSSSSEAGSEDVAAAEDIEKT